MRSKIFIVGLLFLVIGGVWWLRTTAVADDVTDGIVGEAIDYRESVAIHELPPMLSEPTLDREINPRHNPLQFSADMGKGNTWERTRIPTDPLIDSNRVSTGATPRLDFSFEGVGNPLGCGSCAPPDPSGAVGPNHYVQSVNATKITIFNKDGTVAKTPFNLGSLWGSGICASNTGDGIVLYDQLADRWLITQFARPSHMCIAISQTPDPSGNYHLYTFNVTRFPDYFKFGVWSDGYYMSANEDTYTAYAFDRDKMLAGDPSASYIKHGGQTNLLLPADIDGSTLPPDSTPAYFYTYKDDDRAQHNVLTDRIELYELDVDWATETSTFSLVASLNVTDFTYTVCGYFNFNCVRQADTSRRLDTISEWPMFRFPYRNFGTHESLLGNFVVGGGTGEVGAAIRWFELRRTDGDWSLYQEGTLDANDGQDRWLSSIAQDKDGNIAMGYSVSSSEMHPSIRYAMRYPTDPLGTMRSEQTILDGGGSQTGSNRWGDYAHLSVDPSDDCSFWFTSEYYDVSATSAWKTHIGVFQTPSCNPPEPTIKTVYIPIVIKPYADIPTPYQP